MLFNTMIASEFMDYVSRFHVATYVGVEDFADKFNFLYTVILLLICTSIVTVKQYMMKPISCYVATAVSGSNLLEYIENYCWVQGTIPNTLHYSSTREVERLPENLKEWEQYEDKKILYYQWVPFVLGLQCILYYLPRLFWQMFCYNRTGTDLQHLVSSANQAVHSDIETRKKMVIHIANTLEQMLFQHRETRTGHFARLRHKAYKLCNLLVVSKRLGTWLVVAYFVYKLCHIANSIGQIFLMQRFLGFQGNYTGSFGYLVASNILKGHDWTQTLVFPRVTYCHVPARFVGAVNHITAQCVLPVNMLNEKIFIFLWFWMVFVSIINVASIPIWIFRTVYSKSRKAFIKKFLKLSEALTDINKEKAMVNKFTQQFLREDGVFLLQMISLNAGDLVASDVVAALWNTFKFKYSDRDLTNDLVDDEQKGGQLQIPLIEDFVHKYARQPSAPPQMSNSIIPPMENATKPSGKLAPSSSSAAVNS